MPNGRIRCFLCAFSLLATCASLRAQANPIEIENQKPGTPHWQIGELVSGSPTTDPEIAGFGAQISIPAGADLPVKIHRSGGKAGKYEVDVYRLGFYQGIGARLYLHESHSVGPQPPCAEAERATRLVECSAWPVGFYVHTQPDWTSGFYLIKLTDQTGKQSYVYFVVRHDQQPSDLILQINFNTSQAYNNYGGYSLYNFNSLDGARAFRVSYDRPFSQATYAPGEYNNPLRFEYAMAYWLESKGYNVTYVANTDFQDPALAALILDEKLHHLFLIAGHDEYWSMEERRALQGARDREHPLNLAFLSANTGYWRVRLEPSPVTHQLNRTVACYKDQWIDDPVAANNPTEATNLFRSIQVGMPENGLLGVMYPDDFSQMGLAKGNTWRVAAGAEADPYFTGRGLVGPTQLSAGSRLQRLVSFEWDTTVNNGAAPPLQILLNSNYSNLEDIAPDMGSHPLFSALKPVSTLAAAGPRELGTAFATDTPGLVTAIRYWRVAGDWGIHMGRILKMGDDPSVVALTRFEGESPEGWQRMAIIPPVHLDANVRYLVSVNSNGPAAQIPAGLASAYSVGHITAAAQGGAMGELVEYPGWNLTDTSFLRDLDFIPDQTNGLPTTNVYSAHAVRYQRPNGAKVVAIGSIYWPWGLATPPAGAMYVDPNPRVSEPAILLTENLLADLGARPAR